MSKAFDLGEKFECILGTRFIVRKKFVLCLSKETGKLRKRMISLHTLENSLYFIMRVGSIQKTNKRFEKYAIIVRLIKQLYKHAW